MLLQLSRRMLATTDKRLLWLFAYNFGDPTGQFGLNLFVNGDFAANLAPAVAVVNPPSAMMQIDRHPTDAEPRP